MRIGQYCLVKQGFFEKQKRVAKTPIVIYVWHEVCYYMCNSEIKSFQTSGN